VGRFETRFLEVPPEALVSAMKEHQKYFPVVDDNDKLLSLFVATANIISADPAQVIAGNERVIRPRLADATFFYHSDRKTTLAAQREKLKSLVFQENLGSVFDKTERVAALAERLAPRLGADPALARRAAELSKSDLVSAMVLEFADLQGVMGRYYAIEDGEHTEVCEALWQQYWPRFAGDHMPGTATGATLALADRLDTLVGIFGIGQAPSGNRDPFALRRASLGVLRILVERNVNLDLRECLAVAADLHNSVEIRADTQEQVLTYLLDRFKSWYDDKGIATEVFLAVAAKGLTNPFDIDRRVHAVAAFSQLPESRALAAANKRVANILGKQRVDAANIDLTLLLEPAELALASAVTRLTGQVRPLLDRGDYGAALKALAELRGPVDNFFDHVMVMADDAALRTNRVGLLMQLRALFLEVADIAQLATAKAAG
jgi:glycyl-tRNA synthetase beta chain